MKREVPLLAARYASLLLACLLMAHIVSLHEHYDPPWADVYLPLAWVLAAVPAITGLASGWRKTESIIVTALFLVLFVIVMALPLWNGHHNHYWHRHSWFHYLHEH